MNPIYKSCWNLPQISKIVLYIIYNIYNIFIYNIFNIHFLPISSQFLWSIKVQALKVLAALFQHNLPF